VSLSGTGSETYPGNGPQFPVLTFSVGEFRRPATRWLWQMFWFLSLGHLALLSCTQRVMPGILPNATRTDTVPGSTAKSCGWAALWEPSGHGVNALVWALRTLSEGHTGGRLWLFYSTVGSEFMLCALSHFVYMLPLPSCAIVVTEGFAGVKARGFTALCIAKY
jgi:hypothetical protein